MTFRSLLLALCVAVLVLCPPARATSQSPAAAPAPLPAPRTPDGPDVWRIDPAHTSAHFAVRHLLVSTVRGALGVVTGWVRYDGKTASSMAAEVWIDAAGISTGNAARDTHLRSDDFLLVDQHPRVTFTSTRAEPMAGGRTRLIGNLTVRGVAREVTLDVEPPTPPTRRAANQPWVIGTSAATTINRKEFGVKYNALIEAGGAVVADEVRITIDIEARRPPTAAGQ